MLCPLRFYLPDGDCRRDACAWWHFYVGGGYARHAMEEAGFEVEGECAIVAIHRSLNDLANITVLAGGATK